ncbi:Two-component response regulator ARR14 [Acorus calamus]|uniref:Two-component response regulator ARR14 n=1 Tax=Acorus calamus TaxID=4465 RepID=A0AAV9D1N1_ACOCL|nr:Two-component response regulator ARR14 [Acorus calamus]
MGMRVLVLDSDPVSLGDLNIKLQEFGYNVTCSDLNDVVFLLQHAFDLIICDLNVQGRGVFQAAYNMINDVQVPVIMMCDDERGEVMKAVQEGACHCLIKPIEKADLKYIWQHVVRKRMPTIEVNEVSMTKRMRSSEDVNNDLSANDDKPINNKRMKQRFVWTDELREQFVKAVEKLGGVGSAIPNKILKIMKNSDEVKRILKDIKYYGEITRENISSYLQCRKHPRVNPIFGRQKNCRTSSICVPSSTPNDILMDDILVFQDLPREEDDVRTPILHLDLSPDHEERRYTSIYLSPSPTNTPTVRSDS